MVTEIASLNNLVFTTLQDSLALVNGLLNSFALSDDFFGQLDIAFGSDYDGQRAEEIQQWLVGSPDFLPLLEVVPAQHIAGAKGAFASETNTIYIASELLAQGDVGATTEVLLDEIGHYVDAEINVVDAIGDEGGIFSALVRGEVLSPQRLAELRAEDDHAIALFAGKQIAIEKADIEFGDNITGSIDAVTATDTYTFDVDANDVASFAIRGISGGVDPNLSIYDADGNLVTFQDSITTFKQLTHTFETAGTYTLWVDDYNNNETGDYQLSLDRFNNPAHTIPISFGENIDDTITVQTDWNVYSFSVNANDVASFAIRGISGGVDPNLSIYDADGNLVTFQDSITTFKQLTHTFETAGTYTLWVDDYNNNETGDYQLSLDRFNNPAHTIPISFGENIDDTITVQTDWNVYSFSVNANDVASFAIRGISGGVDPNLSIYDADGNLVTFQDSITTFKQLTHTFETAGTYTLWVDDYNNNETGDYQLSLDRLNNPATDPITLIPTDETPSNIVELGGSLIYATFDTNENLKLWTTDGTNAGTVLLQDIGIRDASEPLQFTTVGHSLFFKVIDEANNRVELWKTDGTADGTTLLQSFDKRGGAFPTIDSLTSVDDTLFFAAFDDRGYELWKSDGATESTVLVKDIHTGSGSGSSDPRDLTNVNGTLFFRARTADESGYGLWRSDGTEVGTVLVKELGPRDFYTSNFFTAVGNTLFFTDGPSGLSRKLWKSDGTLDGTVLVKDFDDLPDSEAFTNSPNFADVNGTLFFSANDGIDGRELWKSDGTDDGTVLVRNISPGDEVLLSPFRTAPASSSPGNLTNVNGTLFFSARLFVYQAINLGYELWMSDGTSEGTTLVKDINPGNDSSIPSNIINVNGTLFFSATDGTNGIELWMSDGTEAGTVLLSDINPGSGDSNPHDLTYIDGELFFLASPTDGVTELLKLDVSDIVSVNVIHGTSQSDELIGTPKNDQLNGLAGDDLIAASGGDDELNGGDGRDILAGWTGDDLLDGGRDRDILTGGEGADQFVIRLGDGNDIISDYQDGIDTFLLDGLTFDQLAISSTTSQDTHISITDTGERLATLLDTDTATIDSGDFLAI